MLSLEDVGFSYGKRQILKDISLTFQQGKVYALLGVNGSGKTTLLKIISGLLHPRSGRVLIDNMSLQQIGSQTVSRLIAYMPQKTNGVYCSVFDAVLLGRRPHIGLEASGHDIETTSRIIEMLGLAHYAFRFTTELSGGELQKVVIARALAQEPKILLLDEPISHLDIKNQIEVMGLIKKVTIEMGLVTVVVLHDLNIAARYGDFFIMLKEGEVYASGDRTLLTPEVIRHVYDIPVAVHDIKGVPVVVPEGQ